MNKVGLYAAYDIAAQEASPVFNSKNDLTALRSFARGVLKDPLVQEGDFKLMCIAIFDPETCKIDADGLPREVKPELEPEEIQGAE